jgi:hypothetical protein
MKRPMKYTKLTFAPLDRHYEIIRIEAPKKRKAKSIFTPYFFIIWILQITMIIFFWLI